MLCAYQNYPEYHQYDNITIGATSSSNYYLNGFAGIGTDAYPFKGSISLDTNFNAGFNLNKPLFNAVCDTVQINGGNEILISRKYQGTSYETMPIFATKVVSGDSGVAKASWSITIVPNKLEGNDIMLAGFGGIIGEIGEGATVNVSATMNVDNAETYGVFFKPGLSYEISDNVCFDAHLGDLSYMFRKADVGGGVESKTNSFGPGQVKSSIEPSDFLSPFDHIKSIFKKDTK